LHTACWEHWEVGTFLRARIQIATFLLLSSPAAQVEAIKQAMAGFSLPTSAVPQWAKVVPEDVWKAELIGGLQTKPKYKPK